MSKRGKRSKEAITRRKIKAYLKTCIIEHSYNDIKISESVCLITHQEIQQIGFRKFGEDFYQIQNSMLVPFFEAVQDGTVLTDSLGRGAFQ